MKAIVQEKGQSMIEYILILGLVVGVMFGVLDRVKDYMVRNPNSVLNSFTQSIESVFNGGESATAFKKFTLVR